MHMPQEILKEEMVMVKDCIIYPVVLDVLERDIGKMKLIDFKFPLIYVNTLKNVQNMVILELTVIRKELRKRGIKIYEQKRTTEGISAQYLCRGYNHQISFLPGVIRSCVAIKVCVLLNLDITSSTFL